MGGSRRGVLGAQVYVKQDQEFFFLSTVFRYIVYVLYEALFSSRKIISFKYNDL